MKCTKLKILILAIMAALLLCLSGCGGGGNQDEEATDAPSLSETMTDEAEETPAQSDKLTVGSTGDSGGLAVTLDRVYLREAQEYDYSELKEGNIFMVLDLTFQNGTDEEYNPALGISGLYADDVKCEQAFVPADEPGVAEVGGINPGKSASGCVIFQVPTSASAFEFTYQPDFLDSQELDFTFDTTQVSQ